MAKKRKNTNIKKRGTATIVGLALVATAGLTVVAVKPARDWVVGAYHTVADVVTGRKWKEEINSLQKQLQELQQQKNVLKNKIEKLEGEKIELIETLSQERLAFEDYKETTNQKIATLNEEVANLQILITTLQEDAEANALLIATLQSSLGEKENQIDLLNQEIIEKGQNILNLESQLSTLDNEILNLNNQLVNYSKIIDFYTDLSEDKLIFEKNESNEIVVGGVRHASFGFEISRYRPETKGFSYEKVPENTYEIINGVVTFNEEFIAKEFEEAGSLTPLRIQTTPYYESNGINYSWPIGINFLQINYEDYFNKSPLESPNIIDINHVSQHLIFDEVEGASGYTLSVDGVDWMNNANYQGFIDLSEFPVKDGSIIGLQANASYHSKYKDSEYSELTINFEQFNPPTISLTGTILEISNIDERYDLDKPYGNTFDFQLLLKNNDGELTYLSYGNMFNLDINNRIASFDFEKLVQDRFPNLESNTYYIKILLPGQRWINTSDYSNIVNLFIEIDEITKVQLNAPVIDFDNGQFNITTDHKENIQELFMSVDNLNFERVGHFNVGQWDWPVITPEISLGNYYFKLRTRALNDYEEMSEFSKSIFVENFKAEKLEFKASYDNSTSILSIEGINYNFKPSAFYFNLSYSPTGDHAYQSDIDISGGEFTLSKLGLSHGSYTLRVFLHAYSNIGYTSFAEEFVLTITI